MVQAWKEPKLVRGCSPWETPQLRTLGQVLQGECPSQGRTTKAVGASGARHGVEQGVLGQGTQP